MSGICATQAWDRQRRRMAHLGRSVVFAACAIATPAVGFADVIELRPDGTVARITTPGVTSEQGWAPLPRAAVKAAQRFGELYAAAGDGVALSPALIEAVAYVESRNNPDAVSKKGARGLMQLMPATARGLGVDPSDPAANVHGGAAYLRAMLNRFDGDLVLALAAYNAGPEAVRRYGGPPPFPETRAYVAAVLERLATNGGAP
jgi:soluble lytic murein transglycosylase-like protein